MCFDLMDEEECLKKELAITRMPYYPFYPSYHFDPADDDPQASWVSKTGLRCAPKTVLSPCCPIVEG